MRPLVLADALRLPGHLAIVGDAGCGKTTLLHVILSVLAAEDPRSIAPDLIPALPEPHPLPVLLPLRLFEQACRPAEPSAAGHLGDYQRCAADLLRFVDDWFNRWCPEAGLPPGFLAAHLRAGRAWLLLDALDEVPVPAHREAVRNVIEELAGGLAGTRLLVTARVAAYRHTPLTDRFTVVTVRDLDGEQRTRLVYAIYGGLALPDAERRAADLDKRFHGSESLRGLARTPVMVWTAAVIHALRGELPEGRAALYDAYVDILLKQSFKRTRYDTAAVDELADGGGWPLAERRELLAYAAFQVHRRLEDRPPERGSRSAVVGEDELADELLAPYLQEYAGLKLREARLRAREFLALMVERSGLLYETEDGYTIGDHLTMQEFLAGRYLGEHYRWHDPEGYEALFRDRVGHTWWSEVFLLAAGHLAEERSSEAKGFLERIAAQGETPAAQLVALALAAQGLLQLRARLRRPTWYPGLAQTLANRLYQKLYAQPVAAPPPTRQEALWLSRPGGQPGRPPLPPPLRPARVCARRGRPLLAGRRRGPGGRAPLPPRHPGRLRAGPLSYNQRHGRPVRRRRRLRGCALVDGGRRRRALGRGPDQGFVGRTRQAGLVGRSALQQSLPAGGRRHLVRGRRLLRLADGDPGRRPHLPPAHRGRVGARGAGHLGQRGTGLEVSLGRRLAGGLRQQQGGGAGGAVAGGHLSPRGDVERPGGHGRQRLGVVPRPVRTRCLHTP
jgi:hypothetical protein